MIIAPVTEENAYFVASRLREADAREIFATWEGDDREGLARAAARRGPYSWCVGDTEPVACLGAVRLWPGVWQAWMFATDRFNAVGFPVTRLVRRDIIPAVRAAGAHRVHAYSIEGHAHAHRWMEMLGAVHLHTEPNYGRNREAFRVYAWDFT